MQQSNFGTFCNEGGLNFLRVGFGSLAAAPLYCTHRPRSALHGVVAVSLSLLPFSLQSPSLPHSHHNFLTMRPLASTATALRAINYVSVHNFAPKHLLIAFLSVTNCIPKGSQGHTLLTEITHYKISTFTLRHSPLIH